MINFHFHCLYCGCHFSGTKAVSVKKERQKLFEEFIQAGENWADSSIVVNSSNAHIATRRGTYKLLSREEALLQLYIKH